MQHFLTVQALFGALYLYYIIKFYNRGTSILSLVKKQEL